MSLGTCYNLGFSLRSNEQDHALMAFFASVQAVVFIPPRLLFPAYTRVDSQSLFFPA